ncbi:TetR/AcrR family transcriptional regulator [Streptomyces sp. UH6]|uniref:TetR/AcrR family transcriptional regulator n=1 Tax=Streptomyces sp. UH6 TaxID=2748379 RepID=UPI0015D49D8C|nr:TetR/AcrR family transcriptional regulator [Streptomyces sp. UH6]NYV74932.1 TetR/AcrR family transcriptional regulator [Streptomyces sp. UH6]
MARTSSGLHERLLASALRLFVSRGFRGTSLADIAADVGCSKASLLYHFSNKEAILTELLMPVGNEVFALDERLSELDGEEAALTAVHSFVGITLRFRREIKLLFDNLADVSCLPDLGVETMDGIRDRLVDAVAGRSAEPRDRIAALMALGGIFATGAADLPYDDLTLREALLTGALRTLNLDPGRTVRDAEPGKN